MSELLSKIKSLDIATMLPEMDTFLGKLGAWLRLVVLIAPLALLVLGAWCYFYPPSEANYAVGYRSKWSMQSVAVWRYTQHYAGRRFMILGGGMAVLMLLVTIGFGRINPLTMAIITLICVIVEAVLIILAHVAIEKHIRNRFNQNGVLRKKSAEARK